ncbi:hypothetical protein [Reyranella sp.]|uniref:hypothetical protein n=1 Tax=Reyranella sp. TaxID=1929291 RepID=UPI0025F7631A|nr:hypothetical protein [Reyranella sp.]
MIDQAGCNRRLIHRLIDPQSYLGFRRTLLCGVIDLVNGYGLESRIGNRDPGGNRSDEQQNSESRSDRGPFHAFQSSASFI